MIVVMTGHIILIRRRQHLIHTIEKYCPWIKIEYCNIFNYREKTRRFHEELKLIEDSNISEIVKDAIMGADSIIPMLILHMEGIYLAGIFLLSVQGYLFYTSVGN